MGTLIIDPLLCFINVNRTVLHTHIKTGAPCGIVRKPSSCLLPLLLLALNRVPFADLLPLRPF